MVTVARVDRRSGVLTPSSLACLSHMPTINLTAGCAHGCLYCYTRGYTNNPGDDKVVLYSNTLEKLVDELAHKRNRPQAVYFSPSSDLFQPVSEVLELGCRVLEFLFANGIGVAFLSKGHIPDKTMQLLLSHADKVRAQIGIITVNEDIQRTFEPNAASPGVRLKQIAMLIAGSIPTEARLDPILPGIADTHERLEELFSALSMVGIKRVATSTLFLRPAVLESLRRKVQDESLQRKLLGCYEGAIRLAIHAERSSVLALGRAERDEIYAHVRHVAEEHGINLFICACKNPDLAHGTCNIGGTWPSPSQPIAQGSLFDDAE